MNPFKVPRSTLLGSKLKRMIKLLKFHNRNLQFHRDVLNHAQSSAEDGYRTTKGSSFKLRDDGLLGACGSVQQLEREVKFIINIVIDINAGINIGIIIISVAISIMIPTPLLALALPLASPLPLALELPAPAYLINQN
ncbi:hypothetical protein EYR41_010453 [Orbilia oligospora]|uniref:Uncharacterized protein n=1 Tax=Orbilia oligospora TaxID=2813651 RepID=A0A8H2HF05_ORBOL|nr:hypothetical protein EYR41_010453 [Orbilia oligospora]